jgi:superfamily II DNA or RNA helicase
MAVQVMASSDAPLPGGEPLLLFGFTATPFRHDKKALGDFFDVSLSKYDLKWGILEGWLVDVQVFHVRTSISLDGVTKRMGELDVGALEKAVNVQERNAAAVKVGAAQDDRNA